MTKYILLDIDGVVNALSNKPPRQNTGWGGSWSTNKVNGSFDITNPPEGHSYVDMYRILSSDELVGNLNRIVRKPGVEAVVASTWQGLALTNLFPAVGLSFPQEDVRVFRKEELVGGYRLSNFDGFSWKLDNLKALMADCSEEDTFYWLDDDIRRHQPSIDFLLGEPRVKAISPDRLHGLTRKDIELLDEWTD